MPAELHFLNVRNGDCSLIRHPNKNNTIIDVFNASIEKQQEQTALNKAFTDILIANSIQTEGVSGNFRQKEYPVNPIEYLKSFEIFSVFRFILTHSEMDHMGGIKDFFEEFKPINFWDTGNKKKMDSFEGSPHNEDDWNFYKKLRKGSNTDTKRLTLLSGTTGQYYNRDENNKPPGNGLYILAPTKDLVDEANQTGDYNDCSYVILYCAPNKARVIFGGDSHDKTWEHILTNWEDNVKNVDILIAPHHGRDSKRSYDFLDILKPKLTFFGNAKSEHLAYGAWNNKKLEKFTNNQGDCLLAQFNNDGTDIFCTYKKFAETYCKFNGYSTYKNYELNAYYLKSI